jgi:hypothetical protein
VNRLEQNKKEENHVFLLIINSMKADGYLQDVEANKLKSTYAKYIEGLKKKNEDSLNSVQTPQFNNNQNEVYQPINNNEGSVQAPQYEQEPTHNYENNYVRKPEPVITQPITKEEVRDRNLSWILNIGVVLILLSGIIFGTSTWGFMNNLSKSILLIGISFLFFVVSTIAKVVLKIPKSSNAFWILGSLLFPISLLSIGFFRLFGDNFSVWGDSKYLFGITCALLCLPIYIWSTYRFKNRTFAWITLINVSLLFTFFSLSIYPSFGILMSLLLGFNSLLIIINISFKNKDSFSLFLNEIPLFLQFNLILTTAIALLAYDNTYLYSVNIVLASMLFFAISLSQKKDGYDYVFGLLFTAGMFMLSREFHSNGATFIISAAIGYIFTGISSLMNRNVSKGFRYQVFSGATALIGFIYVAANIIFANSLENSVIGLIALCIITTNYLYLSYKTASPFFGIIVPIQAVIIFYESANLLRTYYEFKFDKEYLLLMTVLLFVIGYMFNKIPKFNFVKISSLAVSLINTFIIFIICYFQKPMLLSLPIVSFVFLCELFVVSKRMKNDKMKLILNYIISFIFFGSLCLIQYSYSIFVNSPNSYYFFCALLTFSLHFVAIKKLSDFKKPLFYGGHLLMVMMYLIIMTSNAFANTLENSVVALIAICIITINHIYLSYKNANPFFNIIVPIQALIIFYESANLLSIYCGFKYINEYLLLMTVFLFVIGYMLNYAPKFKYMRISSLVVTLTNTFFIFITCIFEKPMLLSLPIISFVFAAQAFIVSRKTIDETTRLILNYIISFVFFVSLCLIQYSYSLNFLPTPAFYFFCAMFTFLLYFIADKKLGDFKKPLFYSGHILMASIYLAILSLNRSELIYTLIYFLITLTYVYSIFITKNKYEKNIWFYAGLVAFTFLIANVLSQIKLLYTVDLTKYSIYICGFLLIGLYFVLKNAELKKHNVIYLCIITCVMAFGNLFTSNMLWYEYIAEIVFAGLLCLCMFGSKLDIITFIPLALVYTANNILVNNIFKGEFIVFPIIGLLFIILLVIGSKKYRFIFDTKDKSIDWFSILALISIFNLPNSYENFDVLWLTSMLPGLMGVVWFYLNRKRLAEMNDQNRFGNLLFTIILLWPYYSLMVSINSSIKNYIYELVLLPPVLLTYICVKWIYRGIKNGITYAIEYTIPPIAYVILLIALFYSNNISHSLILGAVGLISILYSSIFKTKSALIFGGALILTSVFIQTRTFWFNIQWWIYLLVLGSILIVVASFNEYQKNKYNEDVLTKTGKFIDKFSDWD